MTLEIVKSNPRADRLRESRIKAVTSSNVRGVEYEPQFQDPADPACQSRPGRVLLSADLFAFYKKSKPDLIEPNRMPWEINITLASIEKLRLFEGWPYLKNVYVPMLWIAGKQDEVTPFEWQQEIFQAVPAKAQEFAAYDCPNLGSFFGPESFNTLMKKVVESTSCKLMTTLFPLPRRVRSNRHISQAGCEFQ